MVYVYMYGWRWGLELTQWRWGSGQTSSSILIWPTVKEMRRRKAMAEASRHRQGAAVAARPDTKGMVSPILIWPTVKEMHHSFEDLKQKHQGHGGLLSPASSLGHSVYTKKEYTIHTICPPSLSLYMINTLSTLSTLHKLYLCTKKGIVSVWG